MPIQPHKAVGFQQDSDNLWASGASTAALVSLGGSSSLSPGLKASDGIHMYMPPEGLSENRLPRGSHRHMSGKESTP